VPTLTRASTVPVVQAGGGVLWRRGPWNRVEIALVHRPRYDDWSLPKGKAKRHENLLATALREVEEESGYAPRLGPFLTRFSYTPGVAMTAARAAPAKTAEAGQPGTPPPAKAASRTKVVGYWAMAAGDGQFVPGAEVDELAWMSPDEARERLSYPLDRTVLDRFARTPLDTVPIVIARAGHTQPGASAETRALDARGRAEAAGLVPVIRSASAQMLLSSPSARCIETLLPAADALGLGVEVDPALAQEAPDDVRDVADRILRVASSGLGVAACVAGAAVDALTGELAARSLGPDLGQVRLRKGGWWLLHLSAGRFTAAESHDP
jgi:8-oxo-dGTP pyrophosphatase MutT (NUDIX family)/phosphohistidine phosphatase SixA